MHEGSATHATTTWPMMFCVCQDGAQVIASWISYGSGGSPSIRTPSRMSFWRCIQLPMQERQEVFCCGTETSSAAEDFLSLLHRQLDAAPEGHPGRRPDRR